MKETLFHLVELAELLIYAISALVIVYGTLQAFIQSLRTVVAQGDMRPVIVYYGRWLIAGLTFMLAADILATISETDWEGIGRLAAIAAVRTFLNYFLERDMKEWQERRGEATGESKES